MTAPHEIWLVSAGQLLYDEEVKTVAERTRITAKTLRDSVSPGLAIRPGPVLTTPAALAAFLDRTTAAASCLAVIVWLQPVGSPGPWTAATANSAKPVCFLHADRSRTMPASASGRRDHVVVGHVETPATVQALGVWVRALEGMIAFRTCSVWAAPVSPSPGDSVSEAEITDLVSAYHETYDVSADLDSGEGRRRLAEAARTEINLLRQIGDHGPRALITGSPGLTGLAVQRLMGSGFGFSPEMNEDTARLVTALKAMGSGPGGSTYFDAEVYRRVPSRTDGLSAAYGPNMLDICPTLAGDGRRLRLVAATFAGRSGIARIPVPVRRERAVVAAITRIHGESRLVTSAVRVWSDATNDEAGQLQVEMDPNHLVASRCWRHAGLGRNSALATNVKPVVLETWAKLVDLDFLSIGAHTTVRSFAERARRRRAVR